MKNILLAMLALLGISPVVATTAKIDNVLSNGTVSVEMLSPSDITLDAPKIYGPANSTTYDWWYFDAASASTNAAVTVILYNAGPNGFLNEYQDGPLSISITGTFANGTTYEFQGASPSEAVIGYNTSGISAEWKDSGFSFTGSSLATDDVKYVLSIDSPSIGIHGTIALSSLAPAHYPCSLNKAGVTEEVMPHVGWANAVPDAEATVELSFSDGTVVNFTDGIGYHDKNWGDRPFVESTEQWYWGHARLGPYSLVWFDALDLAGTEYVSGYVSSDGQALLSSCASNAVVARPWGANDTYPPTITTGLMQGMEVRFDLGNGEMLIANVTTGTVVSAATGYARTLGSVQGGIVGEELYTGRALFEQFALIA